MAGPDPPWPDPLLPRRARLRVLWDGGPVVALVDGLLGALACALERRLFSRQKNIKNITPAPAKAEST